MSTLPARSRVRALALVVALIASASVLVAPPASALALFGLIAPIEKVEISVPERGIPEVGSTITITKPGTWNEKYGLKLSYQWIADSVDIEGATTTSLKVTSALLGKKIWVRVTAKKFLYEDGFNTSDRTGPVENPTVRNLALPSISGTPKMDNILVALTGSWSPGNGTYTYQWLADGVPVAGATSPSFRLTAAQIAKQMSVSVTASASGYQSSTSMSAPSVPVQPGVITNVSVPAIYGELKVGKTIGVNTGSWTPGSLAWTYRWFANGVLLPSVTTKSFVPDASLVGKSLKAEVTATRPGYTSAAASSATTAPLSCTPVVPTGLAKSAVTKSTITVKWTKAFCATKYVVSYRLANATAKKNVVVGDVSVYKLTGLLRARSYRVWVASIGADGAQSAFAPSILVKTAS